MKEDLIVCAIAIAGAALSLCAHLLGAALFFAVCFGWCAGGAYQYVKGLVKGRGH